jgi:hypothetical protein
MLRTRTHSYNANEQSKQKQTIYEPCSVEDAQETKGVLTYPKPNRDDDREMKTATP